MPVLPAECDGKVTGNAHSPGFARRIRWCIAATAARESVTMFKRLFLDHPRSVDENYLEHFGVAGRFGMTMIWGGLCALVHAVVPGWCITTGSDTIVRLNRIMVEQRRAKGQAVMQMRTIDWVI
jgi:hypothetical protein